MTKTKQYAWIEIAFDILENIHGDLCNEHKLNEAEELRDIMRRLVLFSAKL